MGIAARGRTRFEWTEVHVAAGARLLGHQPLYPNHTPFRYPPFSSALAASFVSMPVWLSNVVFHLISFVAMIAMVRLSWKLAGGSSLPRDEEKFKREIWIAILALLCALRFSFNALSHGQTDLLIGLLLIIGATVLVRDRPVLTGICWGFAAAFKGPPLLLVGYLIWRRHFGGAVAMISAFLAANLFPELVYHAPGTTWLACWVHQYFQPLLQPQHMTGTWAVGVLENQSIAGAAHRWLTQSIQIVQNDLRFSTRVEAVSPSTLRTVVYSSYLLLGIVSAAVMWPPFRFFRTKRSQAEVARPVSAIHPYVWEVSIAFCLVLLVSPMSHRSHFCILLVPAMCLARVAVDLRDQVARVCLVTAIILSLVSYNLPLIPLVNRFALYLGFVTFTTLSLLIGCWWMRWKESTITGARVSCNSPGVPGT